MGAGWTSSGLLVQPGQVESNLDHVGRWITVEAVDDPGAERETGLDEIAELKRRGRGGKLRIRKQQFGTLALAVVLALGAAGCKKKVPPPPPPPTPQPTAVTPPPPPPARPTVATFEVEPSTIERGQSATLK